MIAKLLSMCEHTYFIKPFPFYWTAKLCTLCVIINNTEMSITEHVFG